MIQAPFDISNNVSLLSFGAEYFGLANLAVVSVLQGFTTQEALSV